MKKILLQNSESSLEVLDSMRDLVLRNFSSNMSMDIVSNLPEAKNHISDYSLVICCPNPYNTDDIAVVKQLHHKKITTLVTMHERDTSDFSKDLGVLVSQFDFSVIKWNTNNHVSQYVDAIKKYVK